MLTFEEHGVMIYEILSFAVFYNFSINVKIISK